MALQISCGFPPSLAAVDHAVLAEELGYDRVYLFDSPALYPDVFMGLTLVAERTKRVGIGTGVLVPSLRNVVATAAAFAFLDHLAPGRVVAAVGTGFTGRMVLGQRPMAWAAAARYIEQLKALLAGQEVEVDGKVCGLVPPPGFTKLPADVKILVASNGPKGLDVAKRLGDGVMSAVRPQPGFEWSSVLTFGTVLDEGEDPGSDRALAAVGPWVTAGVHGMYEADPAAVEGFPGGAQWRAELEKVDAARRHLALHEGHVVFVSDRDRPLVSGDLISAMSTTGTADVVREKLSELEAGGATEVYYAPAGPDIARELRAFAAAAGRG